ncbi:MAG: FGGY-family carbohydrate kinase [Oscillospiraceae bacterium]|nr:FGGY-family carbohydrate kinase [Oscillospiraceae bacterium]
MSKIVLAYDVGTTGLKACLFRISSEDSVRFIDGEVESYALHVLENGGAEQDPEDWWSAIAESTKKLLQRTKISSEEIGGISFCSQAQAVVMVDADGNALRPCMSCMDTRAAKQFDEGMRRGLKVEGISLHRLLRFLHITGAVSASDKDPLWKYLWVKENEPDIFARTHKWLDVKEYLTSRATGSMTASQDDACVTFLYDVKHQCWSRELCRMFGIDMKHLPDICKATDVVGTLRESVAQELGLRAGTPVLAGGADYSLCQVGAGSLELGDVNVYSGTSGWVCTTVDRLHLDINSIIAGLVSADPNSYVYMAEIETSGKCMEWVKDRYGIPELDYDDMIDYIADVPAGSNGVMFTPWIHGNRCPFEDSNARGIFFNIGNINRGSDLVKSVIEGICLHMRWMLTESEKTFKTTKTVRFSGGSAIAPYICQVLADVLNRPVEVVENPRLVGAMGAAALLAVHFEMVKDIKDVKRIIRVAATYTPNPENTGVYDKMFPVFTSLYYNNKRAFAALNGPDGIKRVDTAYAHTAKP